MYVRTRQSWNDRLEHWEKPASDSEEDIIERAASMVRDTIGRNSWFASEGVQIKPQGSYYNNTNVRRESDMDLRAVHPIIHIEYDSNVDRPSAEVMLASVYHYNGRTFDQVVNQMRTNIYYQLVDGFGFLNVDASAARRSD